MQQFRKRKKRIKLEEVVDEALKLLPRGLDVPSFTSWVDEAVKQNKTQLRVRNGYEKNRSYPKGFSALPPIATPDATSD